MNLSFLLVRDVKTKGWEENWLVYSTLCWPRFVFTFPKHIPVTETSC